MSAKDYYAVLGVDRSADETEIKKAFRKLAQKHHPDKPDGDEAKFKELSEAYTVLSDSAKRKQYDTYGQAGPGAPGGSGGFDFSGQSGGFAGFDMNDIFSEFFGASGGGFYRQPKGENILVDVQLEFKDVVFGVEKEITVTRRSGNNEKLSFTIPPGIQNGERLRITGKGESISDGIPGDLYIRVHAASHKNMYVEGRNIIYPLDIKMTDAVMGNKITLKTLDGDLSVKVPAGSQTGDLLRVRSKGVVLGGASRGDLLIPITVEIPKKINRKVKKLLESLRAEGL